MSSPRLSDTLEAKFDAAEAALYALEQDLGWSGSPDRHRIYLVRCALGEAHHAIRARRHRERGGVRGSTEQPRRGSGQSPDDSPTAGGARGSGSA